MKTAILTVAAAFIALAPCYAQTTITFGEDSGGPGDSVSFSLSIDPRENVTDFELTFTYDRNFLILDDIYLSREAQENGIYRLHNNELSPGTVKITTESSYDEWWWPTNISRLAILKFRISSTAFKTTTHVRFQGPVYYEVDDSGAWNEPDATVDGVINIVGPNVPIGQNPDVSLKMKSTSTLTYGEIPEVHFNIQANGWDEYVVEAYLAVILPDGQLYYFDKNFKIKVKPNPILPKFSIRDTSGNVGFFPLPNTIPEGIYTFYGVLCFRGKNPLEKKNWVSNLQHTHFSLVGPIPAPNP